VETIAKQFERTESDELQANLAGWINHDSQGPYISTEISPKYVEREQPILKRANLLDFLLNDQDEEQAS
jgi:hypothetical protein